MKPLQNLNKVELVALSLSTLVFGLSVAIPIITAKPAHAAQYRSCSNYNICDMEPCTKKSPVRIGYITCCGSGYDGNNYLFDAVLYSYSLEDYVSGTGPYTGCRGTFSTTCQQAGNFQGKVDKNGFVIPCM